MNNPGYNNSNPANSNYQLIAIPNSSDPYIIKQTNTATSDPGDLNTITIATKVDTTLPAGTYTNTLTISAVTNYVPQPILDVYPTTGWAGDTITLYSNGGFVNVQSVQIGGTDCTSINVKSADELTCVLPSKAETDTTSGTDNGYDIQVNVVGGQMENHNFTIRYFNPSTTTSMQEFTDTTCGSMSVGDIVSLTDERNGQTYRIKKMQDEKCWMVDNIKYKGEGITISNVDGTEGIILNDTDGKPNTVDGTYTESAENFDKAFYNNPMSNSYCYGDSIQNSYTKCGYLYNWYAATAGTGTYDTNTDGANVSGSICPTGWRLPSAMSDGFTSTGNGTSFAIADFSMLDASMYAGYPAMGSLPDYPDSYHYTYPEGWLFDGDWQGTDGLGYWYDYLDMEAGTQYSSSTAYDAGYTYVSYIDPSGYGGLMYGDKFIGNALRCVIDIETEDPGIEIFYDGNGADNGSMDTQIIAVGTTQKLLNNTYTDTGYGFIGWNTEADGTGTFYYDGAIYTAPTNPDSRVVVLYAQWRESVGAIQYFTKSQCQSLASYTEVVATDLRDNNQYTLRYIDGNCWMTQNLRLSGGRTLTPSDSNVASNWSFPSTQLTGNSESYTEPQMTISDDISYGGYYNFCAASAGTDCSDSNRADTIYDICPAGWGLPTYREIKTITDTSYISAFSPVLSGHYSDGSLILTGHRSNWWASSEFFGNMKYSLEYNGSSFSTFGEPKPHGVSVRCIRSS